MCHSYLDANFCAHALAYMECVNGWFLIMSSALTKLVCIFFIEVSTPRFILFFSPTTKNYLISLRLSYMLMYNMTTISLFNKGGCQADVNTISKLSDTL
jgi:hypothetical protein